MSEEEEEALTQTNSRLHQGLPFDSTKCGALNLPDKQKLVKEIAQQSKDARNMLYSFTRKELLEIICAELGKERKYTGYTKTQMIEYLLKIVSRKSKLHTIQNNSHIGFKRKSESPCQDLHHFPLANHKEETVKSLLCQNAACRATLCPEDAFCKRCSCCICHFYDDNKDPSLWLTCGSDLLDDKDSCGMSCHLQCALNIKKSGILKGTLRTTLDGSFSCVSCGKINGLMRTWRKQLLVAKDARRVDILCLRISLAHRILLGTVVYKEVNMIVEAALKLLNSEVGPQDQECLRMTRGIVNRLSCGAEVQRLCSYAVERFDSSFPNFCPYSAEKKNVPTCTIRFEECLPTSVVIVLGYEDHLLKDFLGCRLWHRTSTMDYSEQPTFIVLRPEKKFKLENLYPSTEYFCKVSLFSSTGILGTAEASWVTPCSPNISPSKFARTGSGKDNVRYSPLGSSVTLDVPVREKHGITVENHHRMESVNSDVNSFSRDNLAKLSFSDNFRGGFEGFLSKPLSLESLTSKNFAAVSPPTPSKLKEMRQVTGLGGRKRLEENDYEYSVRVVKWLEHEGHIDQNFRVKFLTWFSLKANPQERRVVSAFVDALIDDPPSLVDQLIHTFMDEICCEQKL